MERMGEISREMVRRARPVIFQDDAYDSLDADKFSERTGETAVDVLPAALVALGLNQFHVDDVFTDDVCLALLQTALEGVAARLPDLVYVRVGEYRLRKSRAGRPRESTYRFCDYCGQPYIRRASALALAQTRGRFCTMSCFSRSIGFGTEIHGRPKERVPTHPDAEGCAEGPSPFEPPKESAPTHPDDDTNIDTGDLEPSIDTEGVNGVSSEAGFDPGGSDQENPQISMTCAHRWSIEAPAGPVSTGVCSSCGAEKEFANSSAGRTWRDG